MECDLCRKQDLNFYRTLCVQCSDEIKKEKDENFKFIKDAWSNQYHCLNAILSHLKICETAYYNEVEPKKETEHFFNELADSFILLSVYFDNKKGKEIIKNRKLKFLENIKGDEQNE